MNETPREAARRLSAPALARGLKPVAIHPYTDTAGNKIYWRIRCKHPETGEKWLRPMHLNGHGYVLGEPNWENKKPLYALDRISSNPSAVVWIVEGEQKADALNKLGLVATTSGGVSSAGSTDWEPLRGRRCYLCPDNDAAGRDYALDVARILRPMDCKIECVEIEMLGLGEKEDVVDWLQSHPQADAAAIEALPRRAAPAERIQPAGATAGRITYRRASEVQAKPIRWLWQGRIARGKVSMLAGNPGLGKSQVTASMAAIVSIGGTWPVDRTRCERGNVIFLSAEDDAEDTIRPRLEAAGADLSQVFILDAVVDGFTADGGERSRAFNLKTDLGRLAKLLEEIGDVALIVIDPITAYLGDADSHKNAEIRALLAPLGELAARAGAAVVCVSHLNKSGAGEALMRVTGSLAFVAAARGAFLVAKDQGNPNRRLFLPLKNNIGSDQTGLAFAIRSAQMGSPAGVIETSNVVWEAEPVTITADEAMAAHTDTEERSAAEGAADLMREILSEGPLKAKEASGRLREGGFTANQIRRARETLGIKPRREGFGKGSSMIWELTHRCPSTPLMPIGAQSQSAGINGNNGSNGGDDEPGTPGEEGYL